MFEYAALQLYIQKTMLLPFKLSPSNVQYDTVYNFIYSHTFTYECLMIQIFQDTSLETSLIVAQDISKYSPYKQQAFNCAKPPQVRSSGVRL